MIDKGRQILFKILRMDVGSEHLLAWCKSNARNKINTQINGDERVNFRLAGTIGDVTYDVKAESPRGGNISVKIMLAAAQDISAYFGFSSAVVMRCWCRGVDLAEVRVTEATSRSSAYLTDGVELASVPINETPTEFRSYFSLQSLFPGFTNEYGWRSSGVLAIYEWVASPDSISKTVVTGYRKITFPDDMCYKKDGTDYPVYESTATLGAPPTVGRIVAEHIDLGVFNLHGEYEGFKYTVYGNSVGDFAEAESACIAHIVNILLPEKGGNERREYARRKNCSDSMYTYLRNGFLPPELEYFIKATAPKSNLLKRDIPISITSGPTYTTGPNVFINATDFTTTVTGTVTLEYTTTDVNGDNTTHTQTYEGTATRTTIANKNNTGVVARAPVEYIDFPLVNSTGTDNAPQAGGIFPPGLSMNLNNLYGLYSGRKLLADRTDTAFLMNIANGVENNSNATAYVWNASNQFSAASFNPNSTEPGVVDPPPAPSSTSVTFTHPQFLYDYIAASKPVEAEAPEVPSTNWLSSRLIDGETITVIPLSFINADGEDRGMYPLSVTDEVPVQLKITGYAKTRFNYKTASFTEPAWTEFDTPRFIDYDTAWGSKNCVCIAGKNPYTDTKAAAKTQRGHLKSPPPDGYTLTAEERLYLAVKQALATN